MRKVKITDDLTINSYAVHDLLEADNTLTQHHIYEQYDYLNNGDTIAEVFYAVNPITGEESCYTGVYYSSCRYAVVGLEVNREVGSWLDMVHVLVQGF